MIFIILTAVIWGVTNPLLKRFTAGFDEASSDRGGVMGEVRFLLSRPKYVITQLANYVGSACFFLSLRETDLVVASIAANSLTLVVATFVSVALLRETSLSVRNVVGMLVVLVGISICTASRAPWATSTSPPEA